MNKYILLLSCVFGFACLAQANSYYYPKCTGYYITGTQGDWSRCENGRNYLACRKDYLFKEVFPYGLLIGCEPFPFKYGYYIKWTDPKALSDYLPQICSPRTLQSNHINPGKWVTSYGKEFSVGGILGGEVAALELNVKFDEKDKHFNKLNECKLGDLYVCPSKYYSDNQYCYYPESSWSYGNPSKENCDASASYWAPNHRWSCGYEYHGMTIKEILELGNKVLGGCCSKWDKCPSLCSITSCIKYINHAFNGGKYISQFDGLFAEGYCPYY